MIAALHKQLVLGFVETKDCALEAHEDSNRIATPHGFDAERLQITGTRKMRMMMHFLFDRDYFGRWVTVEVFEGFSGSGRGVANACE